MIEIPSVTFNVGDFVELTETIADPSGGQLALGAIGEVMSVIPGQMTPQADDETCPTYEVHFDCLPYANLVSLCGHQVRALPSIGDFYETFTGYMHVCRICGALVAHHTRERHRAFHGIPEWIPGQDEPGGPVRPVVSDDENPF